LTTLNSINVSDLVNFIRKELLLLFLLSVFELMSYRITENVNLPFKVMPVINEYGKDRIEIRIKLKALFEKMIYATNVVLKVSCPKQTAIANTSAGVGRAKYEPENGVLCGESRSSKEKLRLF